MGERLGKGAFGTVYKGLDLRTGQFVAVKRIVKGAVDGRTMMVRTCLFLSMPRNLPLTIRSHDQKEINFLKTFNHPNIVSYVNLIQTEGHLNLILEYVHILRTLVSLLDMADLDSLDMWTLDP